MNWREAVIETNKFCCHVAVRDGGRRGCPLGGWPELADAPSNRPELRRRIARVLVERFVAESNVGHQLAVYAASMSDAPAPPVETGPAEEKWAFAPGVTPVDVAAAEEWIRAEHSSSPIHLVAERRMEKRLEGEAEKARADERLDEAIAAANRELDALSDDVLAAVEA